MKFIEFAPLNVPLERRLQTLAILHYVFFFIFAPVLSVFFAIYLFYTRFCNVNSSFYFMWINLLYLLWFIYDYQSPNRGSYPQKWYQNSALWKYFANYFPIKLIKTADLPADRNYIIGMHPHGILGFGSYATLCTNATGFWNKFPGLKPYLATLAGVFWFPYRREYMLITGLVGCCKKSLSYLLQNEKSVAVGIVLGGAEEALNCHRDCYKICIGKRRGFVKLALKNGASLVPCYNFGENNTYRQVSNEEGNTLRKLQMLFLRFAQFSTPLMFGRGIFNYTFGFLPFRTPIYTVVGQPIPVEKVTNPSKKQIEELHRTYCTALKALFNEHKETYGIDKDAELSFC